MGQPTGRSTEQHANLTLNQSHNQHSNHSTHQSHQSIERKINPPTISNIKPFAQLRKRSVIGHINVLTDAPTIQPISHSIIQLNNISINHSSTPSVDQSINLLQSADCVHMCRFFKFPSSACSFGGCCLYLVNELVWRVS
jgi:hypothetical protein